VKPCFSSGSQPAGRHRGCLGPPQASRNPPNPGKPPPTVQPGLACLLNRERRFARPCALLVPAGAKLYAPSDISFLRSPKTSSATARCHGEPSRREQRGAGRAINLRLPSGGGRCVGRTPRPYTSLPCDKVGGPKPRGQRGPILYGALAPVLLLGHLGTRLCDRRPTYKLQVTGNGGL
jgi:hypothetical protein